MSYNANIPQASDDPSDSQASLLTNFQVLNTAISVNHNALSASGQGKHKFLQMPEQGSAPTTSANEAGLYTKEADSVTCLFYRQESDGTEVRLTTSQTPTATPDRDWETI